MIDKNKILASADADFEHTKKLYEEHKKRVSKAVDWFNDNVIDKSEEKAAGSKVKVNDITAVCMGNSFKGAPFFACYFMFTPYKSTDDCGSGCGTSHIVEF